MQPQDTTGGQRFREAWIAGVRRHFPADWADQPQWQRETNADIFEAVERE